MRFFETLLCVLLAGAPLLTGTGRAEAPASADRTATELKNVMLEAQKKLGDLEPWQKKIFDDEAVPQYQRFIRDYRQTATGMVAEVDYDILRNYLRFHISKIKKPNAKAHLTVLLKTSPECQKCVRAEAAVKGLVRARLERRGFIPIWQTAKDTGLELLSGKALLDRVLDISRTKKTMGALLVEWDEESVDDIDSAHLDEKKYFLKIALNVWDFDRQEGRLELLENDDFDKAFARLMTDAFTGFGIKLGQLSKGNSGMRKEVLVEVSGYKDYRHYVKIRDIFGAVIQGATSIEERRVSKGAITLAVVGDPTREEVQKLVQQIQQDPAVGAAVKMEVR